MIASSRNIDRLQAIFDHDGIVANAGLVLPATLMARLGLQALIDPIAGCHLDPPLLLAV